MTISLSMMIDILLALHIPFTRSEISLTITGVGAPDVLLLPRDASEIPIALFRSIILNALSEGKFV